MKILIAHDTYPPDVNGAARFTERLATGLASRGHEVHMIAPSTTGRPLVEDRDGVIVHRLRSQHYPLVDQFMICMPWFASPAIKKILQEVQPDVVHIQGHFLIGRYAAKHATAMGIPLVATNHFMPENLVELVPMPRKAQRKVSDIAWWDFARTYRKARIITAPTPRAIELLEQRANLTGLAISCGIDRDAYENASRTAEHDAIPTVLFVGRLDQEKRVGELIKAAAKMPKDLKFRVEIVGDGSYREEWKKLTHDLQLDELVTFRGFIDDDELLKAYGHCDVFVMPGVAELQSLVTLEAMSAGKPVIAANAMALPHLVHPGENGFLFEPGDVDELAEHLLTLLRDPDLRARMGQRSSEFTEKHAINSTLTRFETLYDEVVNDNVVPLHKPRGKVA